MMNDSGRVLVTGGAGFIGSHVADRLIERGAVVTVIDDLSRGSETNLPERAEFRRADLATPEAAQVIADMHPEAVVHCAAQTSVPASFADPSRDATSNIVGSLRVIEACRLADVDKFVYVTTGGALFGQPLVVPWDESARLSPISPYGISKSTVESYLSVLLPASRVTTLRLANVYGPRQGVGGESGVVGTFIDRMQRGLPVVIDGDGEQTRDLLYVSDAVDAVEAALRSTASGVFHIGTGFGTSVNELFSILAAITRYELRPVFGPARVGDVRDSILDPSLAARVLAWQPTTSLRAGLQKGVRAWRRQR